LHLTLADLDKDVSHDRQKGADDEKACFPHIIVAEGDHGPGADRAEHNKSYDPPDAERSHVPESSTCHAGCQFGVRCVPLFS
jgi:hypothetical protein